jgi:hypothetical protein
VQVALVIGSAQAELAVLIQILRRHAQGVGGFDHEQIGLGTGLELQAIRRAARNDDVIIWPKGERAEHGVQHALALMYEDDLIRGGIAVELGLTLGRPAAKERDVVVDQQRNTARDWITGGLDRTRAQMVMAQARLSDRINCQRSRRFNLLHPCGRP